MPHSLLRLLSLFTAPIYPLDFHPETVIVSQVLALTQLNSLIVMWTENHSQESPSHQGEGKSKALSIVDSKVFENLVFHEKKIVSANTIHVSRKSLFETCIEGMVS